MPDGFTHDVLFSIRGTDPDGGPFRVFTSCSGAARATAAKKRVRTASMDIMVFTIGHKGRDGCTGEDRKTDLAREVNKETLLYTSRCPSEVL